MANPAKPFLVLGILIVLALSVGVGLSLLGKATVPSHEGGVTYAVAQAYIAAVMAGDKKAALSRSIVAQHAEERGASKRGALYSPDALCSPADAYVSAKVDEHIALLASSEAAGIRIRVQPREGIYVMPGSESAEISFRCKSDSRKVFRRSGTIWLIAGPPGADGVRSICHLGGP